MKISEVMKNWRSYLAEGKIPEIDAIGQELGVEIRIYEYPNGILELSKIVVPEESRGKGLGSVAMEKIIKYADDNDKIIALTPDDAFGGSKTRLIKFYKRFGFVMNKGRNKNYSTRELMIRNPESSLKERDWQDESDRIKKHPAAKTRILDTGANKDTGGGKGHQKRDKKRGKSAPPGAGAI